MTDTERRVDQPAVASVPIPESSPLPPPVGWNWGAVALHFGTDVRKLMQSSFIVASGEFVPEDGYLLDPDTLVAEAVFVGQRVIRGGYVIGRLAAQELRSKLELTSETSRPTGRVIARRAGGPVIGLFRTRRQAEKCHDAILSGSIGSGVSLQDGPLGSELHVTEVESAGAVATCVAAHAGAVISIGGHPVRPGTGSASKG